MHPQYERAAAIEKRPTKVHRVLLVEDNPGDVRLLLEAFSTAAVEARLSVAGNGPAALALLKNQQRGPEAERSTLILLDLNLPGMDGRELLAVLKADPDLGRIPVLILTSSAAESDVRRAYDLHANSYLVKPADYDSLVDLVERINRFWLQAARLPSP